MTSPTERALALVDALLERASDDPENPYHDHDTEVEAAAERLRSAIRDIGAENERHLLAATEEIGELRTIIGRCADVDPMAPLDVLKAATQASPWQPLTTAPRPTKERPIVLLRARTRALELVGKLFDNALDFDDEPAAEQCAADLRLAITQIPTTSWQPIQTAPRAEVIRLLCECDTERRVFNASLHSDWVNAETGSFIPKRWTPLAWHPADSTDLPPDWPR